MTTGLVKSAAAGAVAVTAMDIATWIMYRRENPLALMREKKARRFGKDTGHAAAQRIAQLAGSDAAKKQPNAAGTALHYLWGMAPAAAYARLRRRLPWVRAGRGALYGLGLSIMNDEIAGRLLGLTGPQRQYPWQAHLRGFVGHFVLGTVTEATLNALEKEAA